MKLYSEEVLPPFSDDEEEEQEESIFDNMIFEMEEDYIPQNQLEIPELWDIYYGNNQGSDTEEEDFELGSQQPKKQKEHEGLKGHQ